ncbi:MAG: PepSY domain-containing protein [Candidatus Thiodiazotropha sp.]
MGYCRRYIVIIGILAAMLLPAEHVNAEMSLDQAVQQAKQKTGGRVISAESRSQDGRPVYNIRILTRDGKVRRMQIRADDKGGASRSRR